MLVLMLTFAGISSGIELSMDQSLVSSTASFYATSNGGWSGYSVAGAGDVNGDGLDDILIGAIYSSENGSRTGKTFLILGRASNWTMYINLSNADASFYGEFPYDGAGIVAGGGDVNGDGFDDILISAVGNDEGGTLAGQVYLIFGKASGWSLDTALADSDASFLGYMDWARAGFSMDCAGDINGDGYDDIVIGAPFGDDDGNRIGRTFVIFGKRSGWSMDTNLSKSDASFIAEEHSDGAGVSVAVAGDVNGDGYDDILIGANANDEGAVDRGQTYLILGRRTGLAMNTSLSNADASFVGEDKDDYSGNSVDGVGDVNGDGFDDILIGAFADEVNGNEAGQAYLIFGRSSGWRMDMGLSTANASFLGEAPLDHAGYSVAGAGDVNGDGYDDFLIGAPQNDDGDDDAGQTYLILGKATGWRMYVPLGNADASYWGEGPDNSGWSVDGAGDVNGDGYSDFLIGARANSLGGREAGQTYLVSFDFIPPTIVNDSTPAAATTGDEFIFNLTIADNFLVSEVHIEFWFGDTQDHNNYSAYQVAGPFWNGTWILDIEIPTDSTETLHYIVHAQDGEGHLISSDRRSVKVLDDDPPEFGTDTTPNRVDLGESITFAVRSRDNLNLSGVWVMYWYGDHGEHTNLTLEAGSGDLWTGQITAPTDSIDLLHYSFLAIDNSSNLNTTPERIVTIVDPVLPMFIEDLTSGNGTTGDPFTFIVEVMDNIEVGNVTLSYSYDDGPTTEIGLIPGVDDLWEITIAIEHRVGDLRYYFTARDAYGNENSTTSLMVTITDNDLPDLIEDLSDERGTTGDIFHTRVRVSDNIGIASVFAIDPWTPTDVDEDGNGVYEYEVLIPTDYTREFYLYIEVTDLAGNEAIFQLTPREVVDDDAPELEYDHLVEEALKGSYIVLAPEATDNVGLEGLFIIYRYGDGTSVNESLEVNVRLDFPRHPEGDIRFHFAAVDEAGNWATTDTYRIRLVNVAPRIEELPVWTVVEGIDAEYDLTQYVSDPNDEVLTVSCDDASVTIENMVLKLRHDKAIPERMVVLTFMDGEDQTDANLTILVVNVNDLPVIVEILPEDGSKFDRGRTIEFFVTATDEENDDLTYTWKEGDEVLGTSDFLKYSKLGKGEHNITVVIDDGTGSVEGSVIVVVKEEEESPGFGLLFAMAAVVLAGIVVRWKR
jgi:hypothetical protein